MLDQGQCKSAPHWWALWFAQLVDVLGDPIASPDFLFLCQSDSRHTQEGHRDQAEALKFPVFCLP